MDTKNDVDVIINGKQYTLSGYETSEYIQKIAAHINDKFTEFKLQDGYKRLDIDMRNILLAINLSDDYYKSQEQVDDLHKENEEMEKEIFDIKHEMISMKTKLEEYEEKIKKLEEDKRNAENNIIRLETELESKKGVTASKNIGQSKLYKHR